MRIAVLFCSILGTAMMLAGCSGVGAPPVEIGGENLRSFAAANLDALSLFAQWDTLLYGKPSGIASHELPEILPDGTVRLRGMTSDHGRYEWLIAPDGTYRGHIDWDGLTFDQVGQATIWSANRDHSEDNFINTYSSGARLQCRLLMDYTHPERASWTGALTIGTRQPLRFELQRLYPWKSKPGHDALTLFLEDERVLTASVALARIESATMVPAYATAVTGTLGRPGENDATFTVTGDNRWNNWRISGSRYQAGFNLASDWTATGQIREGETAVGVLRWIDDFTGVLSQLDAREVQVTPTAAALEASMGRWCQNVNALQPMPMY